MAQSIEQLSFELTTGALAEQERALAGLRTREAYRAASAWIEYHLGGNRERINGLSAWLTASCVLLAMEIILWTLSLAV